MYSQTCLLPVAVQRQQIENCMVPEPHPCTPTVHTRLLLRWSSPLPSHTYSHIGEKQSQLKTPGALIPLLKQKQLSCTGNMGKAVLAQSVAPAPQGPSHAPNEGRDYHHSRGKSNYLRASAPALWVLTLPLNRLATTSKSGRSSSLHLALVLAPPTPALSINKVVATSVPKEKIYLVLISDPLKPLGTHRLNRDASTQVNAFTNGIDNSFVKFHKHRGRQTKFENRGICFKQQNKIKPQEEKKKKN